MTSSLQGCDACSTDKQWHMLSLLLWSPKACRASCTCRQQKPCCADKGVGVGKATPYPAMHADQAIQRTRAEGAAVLR